MSRIHVIQPKAASGRLLEIYDEIVEKRGKLAEVHKIHVLALGVEGTEEEIKGYNF